MFKECLDSCGMVDLGFHGSHFTWVNKREVGHFIQERLDRGFANTIWKGLYPEAVVHQLARTYSDHCPVLLKLDEPGLGLSTGRFGSGLCPTRNRPAGIG